MNSNQKCQLEKVTKILSMSDDIDRKVKVLQEQKLNNKKKCDKIINFLKKQNVSEEEIHSFLQILLKQEEEKEKL